MKKQGRLWLSGGPALPAAQAQGTGLEAPTRPRRAASAGSSVAQPGCRPSVRRGGKKGRRAQPSPQRPPHMGPFSSYRALFSELQEGRDGAFSPPRATTAPRAAPDSGTRQTQGKGREPAHPTALGSLRPTPTLGRSGLQPLPPHAHTHTRTSVHTHTCNVHTHMLTYTFTHTLRGAHTLRCAHPHADTRSGEHTHSTRAHKHTLVHTAMCLR